MSLKQQDSVIYCENNWNDIIEQYDLETRDMEVLINSKNTQITSNSNNNTNTRLLWLRRGLMFSVFAAVLGNIPVNSQLLENHSNQATKSFDITFDEPQTNTHNPQALIANSQAKTKDFNNVDATVIQQVTHSTSSTNSIDVITNNDPLELELPTRAIETYIGHVAVDANSKWKTYRVKSYDNLTNIFHKIGHQNILSTLKKDEAISNVLKQLKKGSIARARSVDGQLAELVLTNNKLESYVITKHNEDYSGKWKKTIFEVRQARASFTINNGLYFDGRKAGVADKVVKQIVKVFDWDIDFSHDVRIGDKVTAVYEEVYHDGDKVDSRHLLAAEFINKGHAHRAIRYVFKDGKADYFTPQGREMKKAFIRTPVAHARISSHFNPARFHPKLHKIRAHKGTDFAARTGTPIMATGNGKIKFIGRKGGYGRTVIIKHREGYTTLYAHMTRYKKGLKNGDTILQGETIGYVGRSGLATGPHLHYEFRQNGKAVNPMTASLPNSMSLSSRELKHFRSNAINLVLQLNVLHRFVKADIEINSAFGG